tara:strand:- start:14292 stop:15953 length:1662 start_codon:yes stop_codon:yes gene_type:complete
LGTVKDNDESVFSHHEECPECGSSDGRAMYTNGSSKCYACNHYTPPPKDEEEIETTSVDGLKDYAPLAVRGITKETMDFFSTGAGQDSTGNYVAFGYYNNRGKMVAQKVKRPSEGKKKDLRWVGDAGNAIMFGQQLWSKGTRIIITEGEWDAMSISQVWGNRYPVISISKGAQGAHKQLSEHMLWLEENFEEIIFMFDNDDAGNKAVEDCVGLFSPGKVSIVRLPLKDANEMLTSGRGDELKNSIWKAEKYKPQGIFSSRDVRSMKEDLMQKGFPYPWDTVTNYTFGIRPHEMYLIGAGTGCGKTDALKEISADLISRSKQKVGMILLEEPNLKLTQATIAGKIDSVLYHIPESEYNKEEFEATLDVLDDQLFMYKVNGNEETNHILNIIRYMHVGLGCTVICFDHVTYIMDGFEGGSKLSETSKLMRGLNDLNKELPFALFYIAHLRKKETKQSSHEEGGRVTMDDFAGGKAITQYANFVFGIERDQQSDDVESRNETIWRCLKDRMSGQGTGQTVRLIYNPETGRKLEADLTGFDFDTTNTTDSSEEKKEL